MIRLQTEILSAFAALRNRLDREDGQALVEYALILALIAVVSIAILTDMRSRITLMLDWHRFGTAVENRSVTEDGQVLIEYALILALIALLTIGVLQALGQNVSGVLNRVSTSLSAVSNPEPSAP